MCGLGYVDIGEFFETIVLKVRMRKWIAGHVGIVVACAFQLVRFLVCDGGNSHGFWGVNVGYE